MNLEKAKELIQGCAQRMQTLYDKPVFDEWAIISFADNKGRMLGYFGPRKEGFKENFGADAGSLRTGLMDGQYQIGDFEFSRHGVGTGFESFLVLGKNAYLICNNTAESMDDIAKNPKWIGAQEPFVELSERFRADPLVV